MSVYLQGMNGDRLLNAAGDLDADARRASTVKGVDLTGLDVADQTDSDPYAGFLREQITYDGSTPVSVKVNDPWSKRTATQHKSYADTEAYYVRTAKTATHTYLTASSNWRTRTLATSYDDFGMASAVDDTGDTAKSGDETCTRTWYARNNSIGITSLVSRSRAVGRSCSVAETALSLPTSSATPRRRALRHRDRLRQHFGDRLERQPDADPGARPPGPAAPPRTPPRRPGGERNPTSWQTATRTTYDTATAKLGRPLSVTDAVGNTTTTAYTPTDAGPLTRTVVTNAKTHKSYTYLDPRARHRRPRSTTSTPS